MSKSDFEQGESSRLESMGFRRGMTLEMAKIINLERQQTLLQESLKEISEKLNDVLRIGNSKTNSRRRKASESEEYNGDSSSSSSTGSRSSASNATLLPIPRRREERRRHGDDFKDLKLDVPEYDGNLDPDEFLEWLTRCNRIFEVKEYNDEKSFKVAVVKLKGYASLWWENLSKQRRRQGKSSIKSWRKMQKVMKDRFLPSNYTLHLYNKMADLKQGNKSVEQYIHEFEKLMMKSDVIEREEQTMARFLGGLERKLARKVEMYSYVSLHELYDLAIKAEKHDKEKEKVKKKENIEVISIPPKPEPHKRHEERDKTKGIMGERKNAIKCFKCQGVGHYAFECPNKRVMTIAERNAIEADLDEEDMGEKAEKVEGHDNVLEQPLEEVILGPMTGIPMEEPSSSYKPSNNHHKRSMFAGTLKKNKEKAGFDEDQRGLHASCGHCYEGTH